MIGLPLDVEDFVSTFIRRMRRHDQIRNLPSLRQGIALIQLIHAKVHRKHSLTLRDLYEACIDTTYFEDQPIAAEIAHELLKSALHEHILTLKGTLSYGAYAQLLNLKNYGSRYFEDIDIMDKLMKSGKETFQDPLKMIDTMYEHIKSSLSLSDLQFLESRGKLEEKLPDISDKEMKTYALKLLEREQEWKTALEDLLHEPNVNKGDILRNFEKIDTSTQVLDELAKEMLESIPDWKKYIEFLSSSERFYSPPQQLWNEDQYQQILAHLPKIDRMLKHQKNQLIQEIQKNLANLTSKLDPKAIKQNEQQFTPEHSLNSHKNAASDNNVKNLKSILQQIQDILTPSSKTSPEERDFLQSSNEGIENESLFDQNPPPSTGSDSEIQETKNPADLREKLLDFLDKQIPFNTDLARSKAESLGISSLDFENMIQIPFDKLKEMIQANIEGVSSYSSLVNQVNHLNSFKSNPRLTSELITHGIQFQNSSFLGAMAHHTLDQTANEIATLQDSEAENLFFQGLRKGWGDNLLKRWFADRTAISPEFRTKLQRIMSQILIDHTFFIVKTQLGTLKNGLAFSSHDLRNFRDDDSIDQVDLDATISHIVDQGKPLSDITSQDILCLKNSANSLKSFIILDKSGSMQGEKLKLATFTAAILLQFLPREDNAVLLFDSNTRMLKDFDLHSEMADVLGSLLNLMPEGGTRISRTLYLIRDLCDRYRPTQKFAVFLFSDLAVYEKPKDMALILKQLQSYQIQFHILYSDTLDKQYLTLFHSYLDLHTHLVTSIDQIPPILMLAFRLATR